MLPAKEALAVPRIGGKQNLNVSAPFGETSLSSASPKDTESCAFAFQDHETAPSTSAKVARLPPAHACKLLAPLNDSCPAPAHVPGISLAGLAAGQRIQLVLHVFVNT